MHSNGNYRSGLLYSGSSEYGRGSLKRVGSERGRKGVGGHSALSVGEHTGPVAHKAAVIFYNVTRQNPWQEGWARRLVAGIGPINVLKSKKLASPARPLLTGLG